MTTIAYDHKNKQIAIDSRVTVGTTIMTDELFKPVNVGEYWFFLGGANSDIDKLTRQYPNVNVAGDVSGFIVKGLDVYAAQVVEGEYYESKLKYSDTDGSGYLLALAALDFGKTAKGAVEYAITRDSCTGGKVNVYDIEKGEFI
jgi:hypothetical protein